MLMPWEKRVLTKKQISIFLNSVVENGSARGKVLNGFGAGSQ